VIDLYDDGHGGVRPGFTNVANNLPGYMQYLDLVRDAQWALGILHELPPNVVETEIAMIKENYKATDDKEQRYAEIGFQCDEFGLMLGSRASEAMKKKKVGEEPQRLIDHEANTLFGEGSLHHKGELTLVEAETALTEDEGFFDNASVLNDRGVVDEEDSQDAEELVDRRDFLDDQDFLTENDFLDDVDDFDEPASGDDDETAAIGGVPNESSEDMELELV
jgi:hypothetical protein